MNEMKTLVIDNGTASVKAGLAGTKTPSYIVPSVVGTAINEAEMVGFKNKEYFVGNEAIVKANFLNMVNPIENGIVTDWEYMTQLYDEFFGDMFHYSLDDICILTGEKPGTTTANKTKMAQLLFETFNAGGFSSIQQSVLALFSSGLLTGLVLDDGEGMANVTPVYEGYTIPYSIIHTELCGSFLTDNIKRLITERDSSTADWHVSEFIAIKDKLTYVPIDFQAEEQAQETFERLRLPSGRYYRVGKERFLSTEVLFDPTIADKNIEGLHQVMFDSIMKCDIDIRKDLYKNIFLAGGTTMITGIAERIEKEVIALAPPSMKICVKAPPQRKNAVYIGASILGEQEFFFNNMMITRKEFQEQGENIINRKCHS
jgi:actin-related protein